MRKCVCIKYSMCDLICESSVAVFEAVIWVKSIYMIKLWLIATKKRKYGNQRNCCINCHLKHGLGKKFTDC